MQKKKILYIATEVDPFLQLSSAASIVTKLAQSMVDQKYEVRIIMPKFGIINERKNRIHEVQRLYGVNIRVEEENISLIVKVASIRKGKIQVYFIDNEDLFQGKRIFYDQDQKFYTNNNVRIAFMCKAVWAILKNLGWAPHIIHCFGWPWVFVPLYGKCVYHKMPLFKNTKFIQSYGPDRFQESFETAMFRKIQMRHIKHQDLMVLGNKITFSGFLRLGEKYADKTTYSFNETHATALENLKKLKVPCIADDENILDNYHKIYDTLLPK